MASKKSQAATKKAMHMMAGGMKMSDAEMKAMMKKKKKAMGY